RPEAGLEANRRTILGRDDPIVSALACIGDLIDTVALAYAIGIGSLSTVEGIVALSADDHIIAGRTGDLVVACPAVDRGDAVKLGRRKIQCVVAGAAGYGDTTVVAFANLLDAIV